jgi:ribonuclease P protein component
VLAAAQRLRRREEFAATIRAGRRAGRGVIVVHLDVPQTRATGSDDNMPAAAGRAVLPPRAGFVVPRAVGNAVARNTVRRRLRHLLRERLAGFPPATTVVVRALPGAAGRTYPELAVDLEAALVSAGTRRSRRPREEGR